jgi:septal ring factor EnvC (AmiA/AmiB activator)
MATHEGVQRLSQFAGQTTLEVEICTCGVLFAVPVHMLKERRFDGKSFYCPNGHSLSYNGDRHQLERSLESTKQQLQGTRELLRHEERSHAATRGQVTRVKNEKAKIEARVAHGTCPCCGRTFKQLTAHMKRKHPDYVEEATAR